jgi:cysteine-S-conjugate beta-lyase
MTFDAIIDRHGTNSLKWDTLKNQPGKPDIIPLWVADMDFPPPEETLLALRRRLEHPIFGYEVAPEESYEAIAAWYSGRYGTAVELGSIVLGPGVIPSMGICVRSLTEKGDGILIMPPVYSPFFSMIKDNDRVTVEAPLRRTKAGSYEMDIDAAGAAIDEAGSRGVRTRAILFCSPHNPGGRVWAREELETLLSFAGRHGLSVISDEIHGDMICGPRRFTSMADFPEHAERVIVLSSPNKTFNLAGLHVSHFIAADAGMREAIERGISASGFGQPNTLSTTAALASYSHGVQWLDSLLEYLRGNLSFAVGFLNENVRGAAAAFPEGTYLIWTDVSELISRTGLADDRELAQRIEEEARVKLTPGSIFGTGGRGFVRINAACPRSLLNEGLERLAHWAST